MSSELSSYLDPRTANSIALSSASSSFSMSELRAGDVIKLDFDGVDQRAPNEINGLQPIDTLSRYLILSTMDSSDDFEYPNLFEVMKNNNLSMMPTCGEIIIQGAGIGRSFLRPGYLVRFSSVGWNRFIDVPIGRREVRTSKDELSLDENQDEVANSATRYLRQIENPYGYLSPELSGVSTWSFDQKQYIPRF